MTGIGWIDRDIRDAATEWYALRVQRSGPDVDPFSALHLGAWLQTLSLLGGGFTSFCLLDLVQGSELRVFGNNATRRCAL